MDSVVLITPTHHASLLDASNFVRTLTDHQGLQEGPPDEVPYKMQFITREQLLERARLFKKNSYGLYLAKFCWLKIMYWSPVVQVTEASTHPRP